MKENAHSIDHILFNHFSEEAARGLFRSRMRQVRSKLLHLTEKVLPTIFATLAMGVLLFIGISLFLNQLAEHGW